MPLDMIPSVAREIDRLVIHIHRETTAAHGPALRPMIDQLGLQSPAHLIDVAEYVSAQRLTPELLRLRFPYEARSRLDPDIDRLGELGAFGDRAMNPSLLAAVESINDARISRCAACWPGRLTGQLEGAEAAFGAASGALTDHHRALPLPVAPGPRLHHLLTGLRYLRLDAHVRAWTNADLTSDQIMALTAAWRHEPGDVVPAELIRRGWIDIDGRITDIGRAARLEIEDHTNQGCESAFAAVDDISAWRRSLHGLEG